MRRIRKPAAVAGRSVLLLALLAGAGCTGDAGGAPPPGPDPASRPTSSPASSQASSPASGPAAAPRFRSYVALGDSFTAGPYVPTTDLAGGCLRSDGNYPSRVARALHVTDFTDVSCSGAATRNLYEPQHPFEDSTIPPQLDAVRADTDLVTLGIGGNDFDLFGTLVETCTRLRDLDPTGAPCTADLAAAGRDPVAQTRQIGTRVADAVRRIRQRAPGATVVLVGYLRLAPSHGTCPLLPFADGDYPEADRITRALNQALARAARASGARFVDAYAASAGHDVCSRRPWVNGARTDQAAALAFHPFAAGMRAVADLVLARLR